VFLEDIDLIGEDRNDSHYSRASMLSDLLSALDGIEQCEDIVTVATTNCLEVLDAALAERPSRFDRVIYMELPRTEERASLVRTLNKTMGMDDAMQEYIVRKTEGYTPAQLQEVMYSMVVEYPEYDNVPERRYTIEEVNNVLRKVKRKAAGHLGFTKDPGRRGGDGICS
jgi:cell division protease FtsH